MTTNITFHPVLQGIKDVKARTEAFHKLSNEDKRKEIAWDALQLVLIDRLIPSYGRYWGGDLLDIKLESETAEELQEEVIRATQSTNSTCIVCARGAVMVSTIVLGNHIDPVNDHYLHAGSEDNVQGFTMKEMRQMEDEYENAWYGHPYESNTKKKLANILCNVLTNGFFNTEDKTDYLV